MAGDFGVFCGALGLRVVRGSHTEGAEVHRDHREQIGLFERVHRLCVLVIGAEEEWRTDRVRQCRMRGVRSRFSDGELRAVLSSSAGPNQCEKFSCCAALKQRFSADATVNVATVCYISSTTFAYPRSSDSRKVLDWRESSVRSIGLLVCRQNRSASFEAGTDCLRLFYQSDLRFRLQNNQKLLSELCSRRLGIDSFEEAGPKRNFASDKAMPNELLFFGRFRRHVRIIQ